MRIWKDERPDYVAACFDRPEPTFRKEKYEAYKAQRPKAPDQLVSQIIETRTLFKKFGIPVFEKPGFEADDLIATIAEKFRNAKDIRVMILTGDLDTLQLVEGDKVVVRTFKRGISDVMTYNDSAVKERYGLRPDQLPDYKAFVGDQSDNVKGITGIGPKTASALLQKYDTLENLIRNLDKEPKLKERENFESDVRFAKSLVVLDRNAPIAVKGIEELTAPDELSKNGDLVDYFRSLGFESLIKRFSGTREERAATTGAAVHGSSSSVAGEASRGKKGLVPSLFANLTPSVQKGGVVFVTSEDTLSESALRSKEMKVGFGIKRILEALHHRKKTLAPPYFDLGIAFWLLNPDLKEYDLATVFKVFLKREVTGSIKDFEDAYEFVKKKLHEHEVEDVFQSIEMPVVPILSEMEEWGIGVSLKKLSSLDGEITKNLRALTEKIYAASGEEFNINSSQQLAQILFEKLGLKGKALKKTAGGKLSTNVEVLEELKEAHPVVPLLLEYREDFKMYSTYIESLPKLVRSDGRIHTEFLQTGTATGRVGSQNPNLQNIPKESRWSGKIRSAFEASHGTSFVSFDYSQIDLRVLATVSEDKNMIDAFVHGVDIHQMTAAKIFGVSLADVRPEMRRVAKTLNFGLAYGMGATAFAKTSGLTRSSAAEFIGTYFREFPGVREWQEETKQALRRNGYVQTLTGRRRYFPEVKTGSPRVIAEAERAAINQPIQGLTADISKLAMIRAKEALRKARIWETKARMILLIHDELLFEVSDDSIVDIIPLVRNAMESAYELKVPLKVGVSKGKNWGEMS